MSYSKNLRKFLMLPLSFLVVHHWAAAQKSPDLGSVKDYSTLAHLDNKRDRPLFGDSKIVVDQALGDRRFTAVIAAGNDGFRLVSPYGFDKAIAAGRWQDKVVLIAQSHGQSKALLVLDLPNRQWVDGAWGRHHALSPSGRYVAFARFSAASAQGLESQYLVYDLAAGVAGNLALTGDLYGNPTARALALRVHDLGKDVSGRPFRTVEHEALLRDDVDLRETDRHHLVSRFSWSPDGRRVGFLELHGALLRLVVVQVGGPSIVQTVWVHELKLDRVSTLALRDDERLEAVRLRLTAQGVLFTVAEGKSQAESRLAAMERSIPWSQFRAVSQPAVGNAATGP